VRFIEARLGIPTKFVASLVRRVLANPTTTIPVNNDSKHQPSDDGPGADAAND